MYKNSEFCADWAEAVNSTIKYLYLRYIFNEVLWYTSTDSTIHCICRFHHPT